MANETSTQNAVVTGGTPATTTPGHAGLPSQVAGEATTVSAAAEATGGLGAGQFIEMDIDKQLFEFESDETPLMQLMLNAKKVPVTSPEVQHFAIDQARPSVVTNAEVGNGAGEVVVLPLEASDKKLLQPYGTVLVKGVDGYAADGKTKTPGKDLMLFITGKDTVSQNPTAIAVNGPKTNTTDDSCLVPKIPSGTTLVILSNAMFETQKEVLPDFVVPSPQTVFCQKRGMNSITSDYFEAQAKRIPFSKALIAEAQIRNFKTRGNRTLWAGRASKFSVDTKLGRQMVYTTEGVRWLIKRHLDKRGKWTYEEFISLAKMIFTGEDVPKSIVVLCGKNFLENIQCIDFSKHPEIQFAVKTNKLGWTITSIHTVFGDLEFKHDPTLDRLGWSNSGAAIAYDRLVHYVYSAEHKDSERVDGHEATREHTIVWDALALKGSCHIWIDGEGTCATEGATTYVLWGSAEAPKNPVDGKVYVLTCDCPGISADAVTGSMWQASVQSSNVTWKEYTGELTAA